MLGARCHALEDEDRIDPRTQRVLEGLGDVKVFPRSADPFETFRQGLHALRLTGN